MVDLEPSEILKNLGAKSIEIEKIENSHILCQNF